MFNYLIKIEYNGSKFVGWQSQKNGISIQEKIENMIKSNIQKSTQWCIKNNVPHNNFTTLSYTPENVFTGLL